MCGPAGTGKSTFVANEILADNVNCCHHSSRDNIRFAMVKEDENYFAREDEVFDEFCKDIQRCLDSAAYDIVYADATHLTSKSRVKTLNKLNLEDVDVVPIYFVVPLEETLRRNSERTGRRFVPETVIKNMYQSYKFPMFKENKYEYAAIRRIDENGHEIYITKEGIEYA